MNFRKYALYLIILIMGLGGNSLFAQTSDAKLTYTKVVDVSADEIWGLLRQMDKIDEYSSTISRVEWKGNRGEGGQRICYPPAGQEGFFKEKIVAFDDPGRTFSYALVEGAPIKGMVNTFKVVDLGYQKSMVIWTSNYEAFIQNPQMTEEQFVGFVNMSLDDLLGNIVMAVENM